MAAVSTLYDNFDDNSLAGGWYTYSGGSATVNETNQRIQFAMPSSSTSSTYAGIASNSTYDLTGSYAFLETVTLPSSSTNAGAILTLKVNGSNELRWIKEASTLYAQRTVGGTRTTVTSFAFNSSTHKWWRIRESGGTIYWDTSTNGGSWTNRGSWTNTLTITSIEVNVHVACYQNETNPGNFYADNFNIIPITGQDISHGHTIDSTTVVHNHVIASDDLSYGFTVDGSGVNRELHPDDLSHDLTTGAGSIIRIQRDYKTYRYKVYDVLGNFIKDITDSVVSEPVFTQEINTASSELKLELARDPSDYGEGIEIKHDNIIKVYYSDLETYDAVIFQGKLVNYTAVYGRDDKMEVTLYSLGYELDSVIYRADESTDQTQDSGSNLVVVGPDSSVAQSFIPDQPTLKSIELKIEAEVASTDITLAIHTNNAGQPAASPITGASVTKTITNASAEVIKFTFPESVTLTTATTYWMVITST